MACVCFRQHDRSPTTPTFSKIRNSKKSQLAGWVSGEVVLKYARYCLCCVVLLCRVLIQFTQRYCTVLDFESLPTTEFELKGVGGWHKESGAVEKKRTKKKRSHWYMQLQKSLISSPRERERSKKEEPPLFLYVIFCSVLELHLSLSLSLTPSSFPSTFWMDKNFPSSNLWTDKTISLPTPQVWFIIRDSACSMTRTHTHMHK